MVSPMQEKTNDKHIEKAGSTDFNEETSQGTFTEQQQVALINAKLNNPLMGISLDRLAEMGTAFALEHGLEEFTSEFSKGACVAQDAEAFESLEILSEEDKTILRREVTHKWDQPRALYWLVVCCSMAAAVQGMDESVINGANLFFTDQFGLTSDPNDLSRDLIHGLVLGAPYLCCATVACWLNDPLNRLLGRRGVIFLTAWISAISCIWQGFTNSWQHLFVARFFLGFGIGPKQVWTAFGIMLGTVSDLVFLQVADPPGIVGLNWRLMLGSAALPAFAVAAQVYFCPESPRWLISKNRYPAAFDSLCRLRHTKLQAARDLFHIHALLQEENANATGSNRFLELLTVPRVRRATVASGVVMFMQQFCGINVIAYYSSTIFRESGFTVIQAFVASLGFGTLNFLFSAPAVWTIDTFGRRFLLLTTFPFMAFFLLMTGMAFFITDLQVRIAIVALGIYGHVIAYSPGEGPVPFTYSAEAFPLYIRDLGMSYAVAITWGFNFIIAFTFPILLSEFRPQGAFAWYAAWNVIGWVLILLFVPETKALSLEELDQVFAVSTKDHAFYQLRQVPYWFGKNILRRSMGPQEILYPWEAVTNGVAEDVKTGSFNGEKAA